MLFKILLLLFGLTIISQDIEGAWIGDIVNEYRASLLNPIIKATDQLQSSMDEVELRKEQFEEEKEELKSQLESIPKKCLSSRLVSSYEALQKWDFDSCVNLTDDLNRASNMTVKGTGYIKKIGSIVAKFGGSILVCENYMFDEVSECFQRNLKILKSSVFVFKNETVPLVNNATSLAQTLRINLDRCIGIPETLRNDIYLELGQNVC